MGSYNTYIKDIENQSPSYLVFLHCTKLGTSCEIARVQKKYMLFIAHFSDSIFIKKVTFFLKL